MPPLGPRFPGRAARRLGELLGLLILVAEGRAHAQFTPGGKLADPGLRRQLSGVTGELIQAAVRCQTA